MNAFAKDLLAHAENLLVGMNHHLLLVDF